jgi:hypothetical protein
LATIQNSCYRQAWWFLRHPVLYLWYEASVIVPVSPQSSISCVHTSWFICWLQLRNSSSASFYGFRLSVWGTVWKFYSPHHIIVALSITNRKLNGCRMGRFRLVRLPYTNT